jgi:hypothetical protein
MNQLFTSYVRKALAVALFLGLAAGAQAQIRAVIVSPANRAQQLTVVSEASGWGAALTDTVYSDTAFFAVDGVSNPPTIACSPVTNGNVVGGQIALVDRGTCQFGTKALNAQNAGAIGAIICNNAAAPPAAMGAGNDGANVTIPVVMISKESCDSIRAYQAAGDTLVLAFGAIQFNNDLSLVRVANVNNAQNPFDYNQDYYFGAEVANNGRFDQTNAIVSVEVTDANGNLVASASTIIALVASSDTVVVDSFGSFTPTALAGESYNFAYTLTADNPDEFANDNARSGSFAITEYTIARDLGQAAGGYRLGGTNDFEIGNYFYIPQNDTAYALALSATWAALDVVDPQLNQVKGRLYRHTVDTNFTAAGFTLIGETDVVPVDTAGPAITNYQFIELCLLDVVTVDPFVALEPGYYLATIAYDAPAANPADLFAAASTVDYSFNYLYRSNFPVNYLVRENDQDQTWGVFTDGEGVTFATQLLLGGGCNPATGTNPVEDARSFQLFPNPTSDAFTVQVAFENTQNQLVYTITDVMGRNLMTRKHENVRSEAVTFETNGLNNGVYFMTVQSDKGKQTVRFVVAK